ncbi:MAG: aspartate ammonia-lyase [Chloroflexi bacterium]|nr:aspartate ammonia-lyase [Chloroflexota bacterium]
MNTRRERDSLGEKDVPQDALYGIETCRAIENFPISGLKPHPYLVRATVLVKKAAALTNMELGALDERRGRAIVQAADEVLSGQWLDQFVVDPYQSGAGVSHHMNTNEVLANRAIEILGGRRGDYSVVHPHDHVNRSQSTNDVFPTSARLACRTLLEELLPVIRDLSLALEGKAQEFDGIVKSGRTHWQDAVPIRLGQEFAAYAGTVERNRRRLEAAGESLLELNLGGTAVGTGINTHPRYAQEAVKRLSELSGLPLRRAPDPIEATQNQDAFLHVSSALKVLAMDQIKMNNDLLFMSCGPMTGIAEVELPPLQPGSSIMPGKVNPVMLEVLNMICFQVTGNDGAIAMATGAGNLELNVYMPLMAHNLLMSLSLLKNGLRVFTERCVRGIRADETRCQYYFERSPGLVTALSPRIGYEVAAEIARDAVAQDKGVRELALERGLITEKEADELLSPKRLTGLGPG